MQQMYNILPGNRSRDQKRRLTKIQDGGGCHSEFQQCKNSLKVESAANSTVFQFCESKMAASAILHSCECL